MEDNKKFSKIVASFDQRNICEKKKINTKQKEIK